MAERENPQNVPSDAILLTSWVGLRLTPVEVYPSTKMFDPNKLLSAAPLVLVGLIHS